ncbi:DUF6421 family protein [Saccharothrix sp. Mg75]|uniref:DUF6421 family protein n=1 Tax=Saccharothrix sp. Mg75 TaxID=3445357 RepID=UPI003EEBDC3B
MIEMSAAEREAVKLLSQRVIPLCNEIRVRQKLDGRIADPTDHDRVLVEELLDVAVDVLDRIGDDGSAAAFAADTRAWLDAGLGTVPLFDRVRDAVVPAPDGALGVFIGPLLMTNSEPPVRRGFEAFAVRRQEPEALALMSQRFPHPKNICQSVQLLVGSDGISRGNCIVFFPENIPAAVKPDKQEFAMFFFNKFRRIYQAFSVPAARALLTADSLPMVSGALTPEEVYEARSLWGYLHDYFHHQGLKPFDEHIQVKINWFVGLLEEIKVDSQSLLTCAEGGVPFGDAVIEMILLERLFRYPLDPKAERVFDSGTGVLLYSWLSEHGAITPAGDGKLRMSMPDVYAALRALVDAIESIEATVTDDDDYRATATEFVRRYLRPGADKDKFAFTEEQEVLRRYRGTAERVPALSFGVGEL